MLSRISSLTKTHKMFTKVAPATLNRRYLSTEPDNSTILRPHFDYKFICNNIDAIKHSMKTRNYNAVDVDFLVTLINKRSDLQSQIFSIRTYRNNIATRMKQLNSKNPNQTAPSKLVYPIDGELDLSTATVNDLIAEGKRIKALLLDIESEFDKVESNLERNAAKLPNLNHPKAPIGDEDSAVCLNHNNPDRGNVAYFRNNGFVPQDHVQLANDYELFDFENAAKVSGSRFYYLAREAALLELALVNYAMQKLVQKGFIPVLPPDLVKTNIVEGAGFQSKDEKSLEQHLYSVSNTDLSLIATAEIPMAGCYVNEIIPEEKLPIKTVAFSHCFRTEAGKGGQQVKGLYRVHQFSKVEMFVVCTPQQAEDLHTEVVNIQKEIFSELGLNFRVLDMPTLDLGAPAYRKIDIEASMPGRAVSAKRVQISQKMDNGANTDIESLIRKIDDLEDVEDSWGEISSASNCTDYQTRRLNIRYKPEVLPDDEVSGTTRFAFTLNGTACAIPRMIIAIMEQHQSSDGTVTIPEPLRPYMMNQSTIPFNNRLW